MIKKNIYCAFFCLLLCCTAAYAYKSDYIVIRVEKNDNLVNICKLYLEEPHRWHEIAKINRLKDPTLIHPGQYLIIPIGLLKGVPIEGTVTFIKGDVKFKTQEEETWRQLHLKDTVREGSGISTGEESAVEITFEDGASFFLRSNTALELRAANRKAEDHIIRKLFLKAGRSISRLKKALGKESRFEIQTPSAVAAAKGTEFRASVDDKEATRTEVMKGTIGVEAMQKKVEVMEGEGTLVRKNEPPTKPRRLLQAPAPVNLKSLYRTMPMQFQFAPIEGASMYRVMLARDEDFKNVVKEKVIGPGQSLEIVGVEDGTYFLQSRSIDVDGLEGFPSDPVEIKVRVNPLPPFIQSPVDGAESREKSVAFEWLNVKDAKTYHVQIAEDREFSTMVNDKDDIRRTSYTARHLDFKTYFFRVSSIAGDGYEGVWSDIQKFIVVPPPPAPPVEAPEMGEKEIHLRWRHFGEGITYHFQMARDMEFKEIVMDKKLEKPGVTLPRPEEAGTYYVRTSGIDPEGYEGDFSIPQSFEIKQKIPYGALGVIGGVFLIIVLAL